MLNGSRFHRTNKVAGAARLDALSRAGASSKSSRCEATLPVHWLREMSQPHGSTNEPEALAPANMPGNLLFR